MKKQIELSLEKAKELYKKNPEMDELLLANFSKEELEKKELPKSWEELKNIGGYYISDFSDISFSCCNCENTDRNIFKTKKQAKSALAMAQLSQLMYVYNDGWEPDWSNNYDKYCIEVMNNTFLIHLFTKYNSFLAFKTEELAKEFLKNFEELIKEYYGI